MLVYILSAILTGIILLPAQYFYKKHKEIVPNSNVFVLKNTLYYGFLCFIFFVLAAMPYFFISAFRANVGTDYYTYYQLARSYMNEYTIYYKDIEFGYNYLMKFISLFAYNPQWFFIITSFIYCFFLFLAIKRYTNHWAVAGVLVMASGMLFDSFNNVRQSLSLVIGICGISYACEKKYIRSVILLFFAYSFHRTVLALVPFYLICSIKHFRKTYYILLIILLIGSPFYIDIFKTFLANTKYASYFDWPLSSETLWFFIVQQLPILIFIFFNYKELSEKNDKIYVLALSNAVATIISIQTLRFSAVETMFRAYRWFSWSAVFIIPMMLDVEGSLKFKFACALITTVLMIVPTYYMIVVNFFHEVYPYNSWFKTLTLNIKGFCYLYALH